MIQNPQYDDKLEHAQELEPKFIQPPWSRASTQSILVSYRWTCKSLEIIRSTNTAVYSWAKPYIKEPNRN